MGGSRTTAGVLGVSHRRGGAAVACLLVAALGLALSGTPARSAIVHDYLSRLTEVPFGAPVSGRIGQPEGLAIDSGDLYVGSPVGNGGESLNGVVDEFGSSGGFLSQLLAPEGPEEEREEAGGSVAVNHSTGEVYVAGTKTGVAGTETGVVYVFGAAGELLGTPSKSFGEEGVSVAVDSNSSSSADPEAGDVYVSDTEDAVVDVLQPERGGFKTKGVARLTGAPHADGGRFEEPTAVAVDQANGDVVVAVKASAGREAGKEVVDVFEPEAVVGEYKFLLALTGPPGGEFGEIIAGVAVDSADGDIYVSDQSAKAVDEFTSAGVYVTRLSGTPHGAFSAPAGVAVGLMGNVYVADAAAQAVDVFGPNVVVPDVTTGSVSSLQARSVTLNGTVNADGQGDATCRFEYGTSSSYGQPAACSAASVSGDSPVPVTANLSGLQPGTVYHYRLDATDANGTNSGQDQEFTTLGPGIHGESVVNVTSSSATVQAQINPDKADTTYYIQYGTSTSYGTDVPTPPGPSIGSGESDQGVSVPLEGLQPDTTYHYRVVAVNGVATVEGADEIFTTQLAGGALALPDGRDWELVSPPNKNAALIGALEEEGGVVQASEDGGAVTYGVAGAIGSDPAGNRAPEWSQVLSVRSSGGWSSQDIAPLHEAATGIEVGELSEYKVFSPELSLGLVEPKGETPLSPPVLKGETQEKTIYLHADAPIKPEASLEGEASPEAIYGEAKKSGGYLPLITAANVPPGTKFGQKELYITFVSATPDLSHVLFISPEALTSNAFKNGQERSIYEWAGGALQLVSVLPDGKPASEEAAATGRALQPAVGYEEQDVRHAVSNDGSRVFWSSGARGGATGEGHLYMRDVARGETIQIDVPESGVAGSSGEPHYQTASSDGSKVFFTDQERLTADSTASSVEGDADLYECEVIEVAGGEPACKLTDVTVDHNPEENAGVQNLVLGSSEVGSYLYFVATGVLSDVANGEGERAVPGAENLYVSHYAGGEWTTRFIAALSSEDAPDWNMREEEEEAGQRYTTNSADLRYLTARVSPDGRYVAFMSEKSLTGYDNTDANSGQRDEEVFLYDANAGRLLCASCDPTGARPVGVLDGSYLLGHQLLVDQPEVWVERWLAGSIPGWTPMNRVSALYQSRYLSDNGRLFFDSADALSPHVTTPAREEPINGEQVKVGTENVYEYEPQGIGSCGSSSETFSESSGGCVGLISSGTSSEESAFLDASASGGDVFFLTASQLAPGDYDTALDVYDAHGCTEASPCLAAPAVPSPRCNSGESCRPAPSPQPAGLGASGSATFSGAGNLGPAKDGALPSTTAKPKPLTRAQKLSQALKACRKKPKRKRVACEKQARKKYGAKPRAKQSRARKSSSGGEGRQRGSGR